jgi:hypothetical protein
MFFVSCFSRRPLPFDFRKNPRFFRVSSALRIATSRPLPMYGTLISERTRAGLAAARAHGRRGGRPPKMTREVVKMAMAALADPQASPSEIARRLGITTTTLYVYLNGDGSVKAPGQRLLDGTPAPRPLRAADDRGHGNAAHGGSR